MKGYLKSCLSVCLFLYHRIYDQVDKSSLTHTRTCSACSFWQFIVMNILGSLRLHFFPFLNWLNTGLSGICCDMTMTISNISGKNANVDPGKGHIVLKDKSLSIILRWLYLLGFLSVCLFVHLWQISDRSNLKEEVFIYFSSHFQRFLSRLVGKVEGNSSHSGHLETKDIWTSKHSSFPYFILSRLQKCGIALPTNKMGL